MKYWNSRTRDLLNGKIKNANVNFNINVIGYIVFFSLFCTLHYMPRCAL